jgi:8-oxo-dGTP pyrophosphatase MutT (NUDIX family)
VLSGYLRGWCEGCYTFVMNLDDKRFFILNLLENYEPFDKEEAASLDEIISFVKENENCFENYTTKGQITGSALVVDRGFNYTLLTHHAKLDKWFQFGGHSDGDSNALAVALREAMEESGLKSLRFLKEQSGIFDVDVHPIPEKDDMSLHNHYDIRVLLIADKNEDYKVSHESKDLKWMKLDDVSKYNSQHAFLRLVKKVKSVKKE